MNSSKRSILLIGAGKFVKQTIFPALHLLQDSIKLVGIVNKSGQTPDSEYFDLANTKVTSQLSDFSETKPDIIFISVPLANVPKVINQLLALQLTNCTLVLTTPIIAIKNYFCLRSIRKFRRSYAFEFVPLLPIFQHAKSLLDKGAIGKTQHIQLDRFGYKYHGLATIRSFVNRAHVINAKYIVGANTQTSYFKFNNGISAYMIEPRQYDDGCFSIEGEHGVISFQNKSSSNNDDRNLVLSAVVDEHKRLSHFTCNSQMLPVSDIERLFQRYINVNHTMHVPLFQQQCIIAAASSLDAYCKHELTKTYSITDALYDNLTTALLRKLKWYFDPITCLMANSSTFKAMAKLLS